MNLKRLYCNGSSLSAGGGLYEKGVRQKYKELYNVEWGDEKDVTYPKYIADHFKMSLIHDAECGSGVPRLIRRTYDFIESIGIEEAQKTLFLFEITDPIHRVDMYCKEINDHIIVNVRYDDSDDGSLSDLSIVHSYSPNHSVHSNDIFKGEIKTKIKDYLDNFHDPIIYTNKFKGELIGLFSFLDKIGITYFYMFDNPTLKNPHQIYDELDKSHRLIIEDGVFTTSHFCHKHKLTIQDDTKGFSSDTHPGYFGYKKFSEIAINFLEVRLNNTFIC
jgi:hypothetical protein